MPTEMSKRYAKALRPSSLKEIAGWADCAQEATKMKAEELAGKLGQQVATADHYSEARKWEQLGELLMWAAEMAGEG